MIDVIAARTAAHVNLKDCLCLAIVYSLARHLVETAMLMTGDERAGCLLPHPSMRTVALTTTAPSTPTTSAPSSLYYFICNGHSSLTIARTAPTENYYANPGERVMAVLTVALLAERCRPLLGTRAMRLDKKVLAKYILGGLYMRQFFKLPLVSSCNCRACHDNYDRWRYNI